MGCEEACQRDGVEEEVPVGEIVAIFCSRLFYNVLFQRVGDRCGGERRLNPLILNESASSDIVVRSSIHTEISRVSARDVSFLLFH